MAEDFTLPAFLQDCDVDTIHQRMMDMLPDDIDKTEAGFPWDFTRPTALIASELLEYYIPETLKLMFPQWSSGEFLDYLGTIIATGTVFATPATEEVESIEFATEEACVLNENGTGTVIARAMIAGVESNVNANTITMMSVPVEGIISITNPVKATGGTEEETDDELRERIMEANEQMDDSYIGNESDYKRWAESVAGIGTAIVVPEWNGPETVKIIVLDGNGEAANETLQKAVYNYIMSPESPLDRLAPPNTILTVSAPELVEIDYTIKSIELEDGYAQEEVLKDFKTGLAKYYKTVNSEGEVKYNWVHSVLTNTPGVDDFEELLMNGGISNIKIKLDQYPNTKSVMVKEGS